MKLTFFLLLIAFITLGCSAQKNYRTHTAQDGETLQEIADNYNVSVNDIKKLNPKVGNTVPQYTKLVLPAVSSSSSTSTSTSPSSSSGEPRDFKTHTVKRKETLFSISQKYDVKIEDLKKYNKDLYSRQLKIGESIKIPIFEKQIIKKNVSVKETTSKENIKGGKIKDHTVQPKETLFGIARFYGITMAELLEMNPEATQNLSIGSILKVPNEKVADSAEISDEFDFYEVQPKEGFFRLKVKLGLSEKEIVALNPYAKEGLKDGMILKIPKEATVTVAENALKVDLENKIINKADKRIAIMLPFKLNKTIGDSLNNNEEILKQDKLMRLALDFYSGVLMAAEFAKDKGLNVRLDVYDTEYSLSKVSSIINGNNLKTVDAVIGPLGQKNLEKAAEILNENNIPVFSPLSNNEMDIASNVFQSLPSEDMLENGLIAYIKDNLGAKNLVLISDSKRAEQKNKILEEIPNAKIATPRDKGFLYVKDIDDKMNRGVENWVILESSNPTLISNVVGVLNGMPGDYKIRLFTLNKNDGYDYHDVSNLHLAKLQFTFPSVNKSYDYKDNNSFLVSYKNKYGVLPNKYAVRGFDLTYDVLLRLASAEDIYKATNDDFETEYIENKFRYKKGLLSGYQNTSIYIMKYMDDLSFEVVE